MFMITNLIGPRIGKQIQNHLILNNYPEFRNERLESYLFKRTLRSGMEQCTLFLGSRFQKHPDSVILQKYQSLSNQTFKVSGNPCDDHNLTSIV